MNSFYSIEKLQSDVSTPVQSFLDDVLKLLDVFFSFFSDVLRQDAEKKFFVGTVFGCDSFVEGF